MNLSIIKTNKDPYPIYAIMDMDTKEIYCECYTRRNVELIKRCLDDYFTKVNKK
jgi:hypothetical protein